MKYLIMLLIIISVSVLSAKIPVQPVNFGEANAGETSNPYKIETWQNLYWISQNSEHWNKHYILIADIYFPHSGEDDIKTWHDNTGWATIGYYILISDPGNIPFSGTYDGDNYTINGLYINRPNNSEQALFSYITGSAKINNLTLDNVSINAKSSTAGLVAFNYLLHTEISNVSVKGLVTGENYVGGLIGWNHGGQVTNCTFEGTVNGIIDTGGLIGFNAGTVNESSSTGEVISAIAKAGGLIGQNAPQGIINNSYSSSNVTGSFDSGGFVGWNNQGTINYCYSKGDVSGNEYAGGFSGANSGTINQSYCTGNVSGNQFTGGFTGWMESGQINNSYSRSPVTRKALSSEVEFGGFIGRHWGGAISKSYSTGQVIYTDTTNPVDKGFCGYLETVATFSY